MEDYFDFELVESLVSRFDVDNVTAHYLAFSILLVGLIIGTWLTVYLTRKFLLVLIDRLTAKTKTQVDDILVENRFFQAVAHLLPAMLINSAAPTIFVDFESFLHLIIAGTQLYVVAVFIRIVNALLNSITQYLLTFENLKDKPIGGYFQLGKIINYVVGIILIISIVSGKSPIYFFSAMGAMTAVLLLIFKDTILGFVASIQLAGNDMVRLGDWITMDKYMADGDVFEINLTTIKVRNFDMTITTIPTYAFISDSFKNWRGMTASNGRRFKRDIHLKLGSIHHASQELIERLKSVGLISSFIDSQNAEIEAHNATLEKLDLNNPLNGRKMTNAGLFRAYMLAYVQSHEGINQEMTCMIRQLPVKSEGMGLEVYCFTKTKVWADYEGIMADTFDHFIAAAPHFELEIFQKPAGTDFKALAQNN